MCRPSTSTTRNRRVRPRADGGGGRDPNSAKDIVARIGAGLGYGLDEAALEAAKRAAFEPATRCGKPVSATFVIAMRFSL